MEYLEGLSLADDMKQNGRLKLQKFKDVFLPVLSALEQAHQRGLVHRDIKPGNIMICRNENGSETVKLVDFGIAKFFGERDGETQDLTKSGVVLGSPTYMSPEQCQGKPLDCRSDLYSTACVMYETLSGEPPFSGDSLLEVMQKHSMEPPPTVSDLSRKIDIRKELAKVTLWGLAKDPAARPQSASEFARKLNETLERITLEKVPRLKNGNLLDSETKQQLNKILVAAFVFSLVVITVIIVQRPKHPISFTANSEPKKVKDETATQSLASKKEPSLDRRVADADGALESDNWRLAADSYNKIIQSESTISNRLSKEHWKRIHYNYSIAQAHAFFVESKPAQAQETLKRALTNVLHDFGPDSYQVAEVQFQLAKNYFSMGSFAEAETQANAALATRTKMIDGENTTSFASILNLLAEINEKLGKVDKGLVLQKRALSIWEATAGERDNGTLRCMFSLGMALYDAKRLQESEYYLERMAIRAVPETGELGPRDRYNLFFDLCAHYKREGNLAKIDQTYNRMISSVQNSKNSAKSKSQFYLGRAYLAAAQYYCSKNQKKKAFELAEQAKDQFTLCSYAKTPDIETELTQLYADLKN